MNKVNRMYDKEEKQKPEEKIIKVWYFCVFKMESWIKKVSKLIKRGMKIDYFQVWFIT